MSGKDCGTRFSHTALNIGTVFMAVGDCDPVWKMAKGVASGTAVIASLHLRSDSKHQKLNMQVNTCLIMPGVSMSSEE